MSLFRTALVAGVLIYTIPTDPQKQQELLRSAGDTIEWARSYCDREPETCRRGSAALSDSAQKLKFAMALVSDLASKWSHKPEATASLPQPHSTLTIDDALTQAPADGASSDAPSLSGPAIKG